MKREVISFRLPVDPQVYMGRIVERIKDDGVIEEIRIRFYNGANNNLTVTPYVSHKIKARENLITFAEGSFNLNGSKDSVYGNDDYFVFPVLCEVAYDDDLIIEYSNFDNTNPLLLAVDVIISYNGDHY